MLHILMPPSPTTGTCIERLSTGVIVGVVIGSVVVSVMIFIAGCGAGIIAILVYQKTSTYVFLFVNKYVSLFVSKYIYVLLFVNKYVCFCLSTGVHTLVLFPHHSLQNPLNLQNALILKRTR